MDAALRIFLIVSGDLGGHRVQFFWPPVNNETPSQPPQCHTHHKSENRIFNSSENVTHLQRTSSKELTQLSSSENALASLKLSKSRSQPISTPRITAQKEWTFNMIEKTFRIYDIPLSDLGYILFPSHRYHHQIFELKIDNILYLSYPFCWQKKQRRTKDLDGFSVVFAINLRRHSKCKLTEDNKKMWFDLIIKYVRIVQHEERRMAYLSSQMEKMNKITHSVIAAANKRRKSLKKEEKKSEDTKEKLTISGVVKNILSEIANECDIANDIKRIQQTLSTENEIKLLINGWVELHCSLKVPQEHIGIRPYQTLLVLPQTRGISAEIEEKKQSESELITDSGSDNLRCIRKDAYDLLQQIPISGSQSLRLMISTANICSSFGDMASVTNIPLPTLLHFALHLKYWGKADIIQTINKSSQFVIHPKTNFAMIGKNSAFQRQFKHAFPHRKLLIEELVRFNFPQMLCDMSVCGEYDKKQDFIFLIAWLLQRNLLIRLNRYVHYIEGIGQKVQVVNAKKCVTDQMDMTKEKLNVLWKTVKPYLNGQNHFLEIMFQTGLSSKKLQFVINEFNDHLISYSHFDDYQKKIKF